MSFENLSRKENALDERWFDRFAELSFETYSLLDGDSEVRIAEKNKFLAQDFGNPTLDYPKLKGFDFIAREVSLLNLKAEIIDNEDDITIREIYRTKINESLAELRMLKSTIEGNDKKFNRYSTFVYGAPDEVNTSIMASILQEKVERGKTPVKQEAAANLRPILEVLVPVVPERGPPLLEIEDSKERVATVDEVVSAFTQALQDVGAGDAWRVVVSNDIGISNFRVSQKNKEVSIPGHKIVGMLSQTMRAFLQHEVFGHVARRVAGENSKLKLLALGLDRYEKGEEGVATRLEQLEKGADTFSHPERYFAISLARGEVDGIKRDFRQTFNVLKQYYVAVLLSSQTGPTLEDKAADSAWRLCVRTFRGTTGSTPGTVYTKDLNYFVGNKETWALVKTDEKVVRYFSIGKFDAANSRHVGWLMKLGITDQSLKNILEESNDQS